MLKSYHLVGRERTVEGHPQANASLGYMRLTHMGGGRGGGGGRGEGKGGGGGRGD